MSDQAYTIGVLGGMGTYAAIYLFQEYARIFEAEKEWDRPRLIIDNRCTMPSRTKAYLTGEGRDTLLCEMADSLSHLCEMGCSRILLACNTAHLFLPDLFEWVPGVRGRIVSLIETCVDAVVQSGVSQVFLLASEGTIESQVYQKALSEHSIRCTTPVPEEYAMLRTCIEAVKQDQYPPQVRKTFLELISGKDCLLLGCTELPILYRRYREDSTGLRVFDPVEETLKKLRMEYLK